MKIALLGYGKMGKLIHKMAEMEGVTVTAIRSKEQKDPEEKIAEADVCIDFSHFSAILDHARLSASYKKPLVIGTTGWEKDRPQLFEIIQKSSIGCIHSPNFSLGVALFKAMTAHAAKLMKNQLQYDATGVESHHMHKVDSPSGTAIDLQAIIEKEGHRKIPFSSVRCGSIPGIHEIIFDSPFDTISLKHEARNREGFALGALTAARWIIGKKGLYTMEDLCRFD